MKPQVPNGAMARWGHRALPSPITSAFRERLLWEACLREGQGRPADEDDGRESIQQNGPGKPVWVQARCNDASRPLKVPGPSDPKFFPEDSQTDNQKGLAF